MLWMVTLALFLLSPAAVLRGFGTGVLLLAALLAVLACPELLLWVGLGVVIVVMVITIRAQLTMSGIARRKAARDAAFEAFRNEREVNEEIRLILSPDFDLATSVVPRGPVGAHRRRPGSWRKRGS